MMMESKDFAHLTSEIEQMRFRRHAMEVCLRIPYKGSVLDLGCGSGALLGYIREERKDVFLTGIDLNEWDSWEGLSGVSFVRGNALSTRFLNSSFDVVVSSGLFEHVDNMAYVNEVFRILKPGGYHFVFNVPNKYGLGENLSRILGLTKLQHGELEQRYTRPMLEYMFGVVDLHFKAFQLISLKQEGFVPAQFGVVSRRLELFINRIAKYIMRLDDVLSFMPFCQSFNLVLKMSKDGNTKL